MYVKNSLSFDIVIGDLFNISNCDVEFSTICIKTPAYKTFVSNLGI